MPDITLIKLGGSVITDKEIPKKVRLEVLERLATEIAESFDPEAGLYIVGHGQGSFAHEPASKYQTKAGFIDEAGLVNANKRLGMAITQDSAAQLSRIVLAAFLQNQLPAVNFYMSNALVTTGGQAQHFADEVLFEYLAKGLLPVTGGDVIVDQEQGCTIWSTETILSFLAERALTRGFKVKKIIHVTEVAGVLDQAGQVVEEISYRNQDQVKDMIGATKGFDVTGGMWHKIEESLVLTKQGIESLIVSGLEPGNLAKALRGEAVLATRICS